MIVEFVALLLPVAAASGWYAARRHYESARTDERARRLTRGYCRGLNYLLSERPEKAFAVFTDLLERDPETVDTHLALGNLFRRRGEVERAIEVHERLLQEPDLSQDQRDQAHFELGLDYLRAGLLDRAEFVFHSLRNSPWRGRGALQQLLQIYQQERDWHKAIDCVEALRAQKQVPQKGETVAQFLCELADEAYTGSKIAVAEDYLTRALADDARCVRASLMLAKIEIERESYAAALRVLQRVESQNPAYLPEILPSIAHCLRRLGRTDEFIAYAQRLDQQYELPQLRVEIADYLAKTQGPEAATAQLHAALQAKPTLRGASRILEFLASTGTREDKVLVQVTELLQVLAAEAPHYRCLQCGFSGGELHWHCPSCQHWGAVIPWDAR